MRLFALAVWAIAASLVMASFDAVPDPPALTPHTVDATSVIRVHHGGPFEQHSDRDWRCISSQFPVLWIGLTHPYEANRSSDAIALTERAADPSPPCSLTSAATF
jgi:hypothetical protein